MAAALTDIGRLQWTTGNDKEAWAAALRAESIARDHFRLSEAGLSEREALQFEATRNKGLDLGKGDAARAFDAVIRGRSMVLDALARRHNVTLEATTQDMAALLEVLKDNKERLARLAVQGPDDAHPENYIADLQKAQETEERAERKLAMKAPPRTEAATGLPDVQGLELIASPRRAWPAAASSPFEDLRMVSPAIRECAVVV